MYNPLPFAKGCCNCWTTIRRFDSRLDSVWTVFPHLFIGGTA